MESDYLVYRGEGAHVWRFVHIARAPSPRGALEAARAEAEALGNEFVGLYMVVPRDAARVCAVHGPDADGTHAGAEGENRA